MNKTEIWFWQQMMTPHMSELAVQLSLLGCKVTYIAREPISKNRVELGWAIPELHGVEILLAPTIEKINLLIEVAPFNSIHICQGLRGNGAIKYVQNQLRFYGLKQWVIMETVDDSNLFGLIKKVVYIQLFHKWRNYLQGILAIGQSTDGWVVSKGMPKNKVFKFAYFLKETPINSKEIIVQSNKRFRFIFVGVFEVRKRLDLLIKALENIREYDFELIVVGSGPLESSLRLLAEKSLPNRVQWLGRLSIEKVPMEISKADYLVLPSRHDGWGAVISEALIVGTPVICSDSCGAAEVVRNSRQGGVFKTGNSKDLIIQLRLALCKGVVPSSERAKIIDYANCLGAKAGAKYLLHILDYKSGIGSYPNPPWK